MHWHQAQFPNAVRSLHSVGAPVAAKIKSVRTNRLTDGFQKQLNPRSRHKKIKSELHKHSKPSFFWNRLTWEKAPHAESARFNFGLSWNIFEDILIKTAREVISQIPSVNLNGISEKSIVWFVLLIDLWLKFLWFNKYSPFVKTVLSVIRHAEEKRKLRLKIGSINVFVNCNRRCLKLFRMLTLKRAEF